MNTYNLNKELILNSKIKYDSSNKFYSIQEDPYFEIKVYKSKIILLEINATIDKGDFIEIYWKNSKNDQYTKEKNIRKKINKGIYSKYLFEIPQEDIFSIRIDPTNKKDSNIYIESIKSFSNKEEILSIYKNIPQNMSKSIFEYTDKISIITVNHNCSYYIKMLLDSIIKNVRYKNLEVIIVDNASTDDSLNIIKTYNDKLDIKIIKNKNNETYSKANNQAASISNGKYLLFVNNDVEVSEGWLESLLYAQKNEANVGLTGSLLLYPYSNNINNKSLYIQHCGIKFKKTNDGILPYNFKNGDMPESALKNTEKISAVTGASFMIEKEKFNQVNGFCEDYTYGYEDVDISLKMIKKGYSNYIVPSSIAFHYEFGTQSKQSPNIIKQRRLKNKEIFNNRWNKWLEKKIIEDLIEERKIFIDKKIKVAFAVTEAGERAKAGDYFTALDFAQAMKKRGWDIDFLQRKSNNWYQVSDDTDIIISLLDTFDITKVKCQNKNLITIAWARNWFERWVSTSFIKKFDYILASSEIACEYMEKKLGRKVHLFKIATNKDRFFNTGNIKSQFKCDYCFTGSYWNDYREIIDMLNPNKLSKFKFNIYGYNWDKVSKFKSYSRGFINYKEMVNIYKSTKIIIDDANRVTKPFGSVNSRVFDALCSGVLVITNGELGSKLTFNGKLPTYNTEKELTNKIKFYLENESKRKDLIKELQSIVIKEHTYDIRVNQLLKILKQNNKLNQTILIKTSVPNKEISHEWGDYYFVKSMIKEFEKLGYNVRMQFLNQWDEDDGDIDIVIMLRGLSKYIPKDYHYNIMWNISHPNSITIDEYYNYDTAYIASEYWANEIRNKKINNYTKVETLLQCTDPEVFKPYSEEKFEYELLFVGNSRKVFRRAIKDIIPTKYNLAVYGTNWNIFIDKFYIKGENIPNDELYKHYSNAKITLNDHWDDMKEKGFISNRIFDVLASKGFVITDNVKDLEKYFGNSVIVYKGKSDLNEKLELYINNEHLRQLKIDEAYNIVINNHTFKNRIQIIYNNIKRVFL